jgi:glycosyltransferase involved in cell wall biosynthesis
VVLRTRALRPRSGGGIARGSVLPKITIITPSFNQARFIERTISSVLEQRYEELEYFVVDGGSTDGSVEIIRQYEADLSWWVSEPDSGQTDAINKGLRRATGDVIAFINSDDHYVPGAFDKAVAAFETTGARWIVGACRYVYEDGSLMEVWTPELPRTRRYRWIVDPVGWPQASTFWRRDVFEEFGLFREDMHYIFDTEFGVRLALAGVMPGLSDDELAVRLWHEAAKSWDRRPAEREELQLLRLHPQALSRGERIRLLGPATAKRLGLYRLGIRPRLRRLLRRQA